MTLTQLQIQTYDSTSRTRCIPPTSDDAIAACSTSTSKTPTRYRRTSALSRRAILDCKRIFIRMFASEAKPTQNNTRDSLRTHLGVNLGTGHKTFETAGFPQHVWRDAQVIRRMGPKSPLAYRRVSLEIPRGVLTVREHRSRGGERQTDDRE